MRWSAKETPQLMVIHSLLRSGRICLSPFLTATLAVEKKKEAFLTCRSVSYTWIEGPRRFFTFKEQTLPLSLWITVPDESNSFYCHYSRCSHIYPQWPNQSIQTPNKYSRKNTRFYNSISQPWQEKIELPLQVGFSHGLPAKPKGHQIGIPCWTLLLYRQIFTVTAFSPVNSLQYNIFLSVAMAMSLLSASSIFKCMSSVVVNYKLQGLLTWGISQNTNQVNKQASTDRCWKIESLVK